MSLVSKAALKKLFNRDNQSVVHILSSGSSSCKHIMYILRYLFYVCSSHNSMLRAVHIPGVTNFFADCLSRLQVTKLHVPPLSDGQQASDVRAVCSLDQLHVNAKEHFRSDLVDSSYRTYGVSQLQFLSFCDNYGLSPLGTGRHINHVRHFPGSANKASVH